MEEKEKIFGTYLREIRENYEFTLRKFAEEAELDPAYLSRIERGLIHRPGREIIERITDAFCRWIHLNANLILSNTYNPDSECEELKRQLLLIAGYKLSDAELLGFKTGQSSTPKDLFADRLREKGVPEKLVNEAMINVPQHLMTKVLSGEESLFSFIESKDHDSESINKALSNPTIQDISHTPLVSKKTSERKFRAGARAEIVVNGDLSFSQEKQLRAITTLVRSILVAEEKADKLEAQVERLNEQLDEMKSKGNK